MEYIWRIPDNYPQSLIGSYDRENGPDRFLLKKGRALGRENGPWRFKFSGPVSRLRAFDDLANSAMVPLVSPRLAVVLQERAAQDIELLPAEVEARDGAISDYQLLNITTLLPAVDREHSEYKPAPGTDKIMKFRRLVLAPGCMQGHFLARCAEYSSFLLVAATLAAAVQEAEMTGVQLTEPAEVGP